MSIEVITPKVILYKSMTELFAKNDPVKPEYELLNLKTYMEQFPYVQLSGFCSMTDNSLCKQEYSKF